jgi:hypothetical protein
MDGDGDQKINDLLNALENDGNTSIMKLNNRKIKTIKNNVLQQLPLDGDIIKTYHKKLKEYRYCDEFPDIQMGYYCRWINLNNPSKIHLTNGGIIIDIKMYDDGLQLVCKNNRNMVMQIKFNEIILFQKLSNQEKVILSVLDYLDK